MLSINLIQHAFSLPCTQKLTFESENESSQKYFQQSDRTWQQQQRSSCPLFPLWFPLPETRHLTDSETHLSMQINLHQWSRCLLLFCSYRTSCQDRSPCLAVPGEIFTPWRLENIPGIFLFYFFFIFFISKLFICLLACQPAQDLLKPADIKV